MTNEEGRIKSSLASIKRRAGISMTVLALIALAAHRVTELVVREFSLHEKDEIVHVMNQLSLARIILVFLCLGFIAFRLIWPLIRTLEKEMENLEMLNLTLEGKVRERTESLSQREASQRRQTQVLQGMVEELQEMDRQRSEFVSAVTHELRTPLVSLKGGISLLRSSVGRLAEGDLAKLQDSLARNADRLGRQVEDVLAASGLEKGTLELDRKPVDLQGLVEGAVRALEHYSAKHRILLAWNSGPAEVLGDPFRLEQVFLNILSNAIKYSPEGGLIEVSSEATESGASVTVRDPGLGIPAEALDSLFKKFGRVRSDSHRGIPGTGLGLFLVKEIVEKHGGRVTVESRPKAGAAFTVELPLSKMKAAA